MPPSVFVIDTSYLMELYEVPGHHDPSFVPRLKARFAAAINAKSRFFVPFPALFEWANHIAGIKDGSSRITHARKLYQLVAEVVGDSATAPWLIWGADQEAVAKFAQSLLALIQDYAEQYAAQSIGLSDTAMIQAAKDLKAKYRAFGEAPVYIWTKDHSLKAHEPDREPNPLLQ